MFTREGYDGGFSLSNALFSSGFFGVIGLLLSIIVLVYGFICLFRKPDIRGLVVYSVGGVLVWLLSLCSCLSSLIDFLYYDFSSELYRMTAMGVSVGSLFARALFPLLVGTILFIIFIVLGLSIFLRRHRTSASSQ